MSGEGDPRRKFAEKLRALREAAGVSIRDLVVESAKTSRRHPGQQPLRLKRGTVGGMLSLRHPVRPEQEHFEVLVDTCIRLARAAGRPLPEGLGDVDAWNIRYEDLLFQLRDLRSAVRLAGDAERALSARDETDSPYRGLQSFGVDDARIFFGRAPLVALLVERLRNAAHGPILVTGPSGAGKSSLLRAGLIPVLRDEGRQVSVLTPGTAPLAALDRCPAEAALIIDQFEELFTLCADEAERGAFIAALAARAASGRIVVLGVRADFLGHCIGHTELASALERPVVVGPMTREQLREVIEGPAVLAGLSLEDGLTELLLEDLGTDTEDVLPLLSHALFVTWRNRRDRRLTMAAYRAAGGVSGALQQTAETALTDLDETAEAAVRRMLLHLVRLGEGTEDTRRRVSLSELPGAEHAVLDRLIEARLLSLGSDTIQLTHESLIRSWPRLRAWIDADRAALLLRQQVDDDAGRWQDHQQDPAFLYRGKRLASVLSLSEGDRADDLTPVAASFLTRSSRAEIRRRRLRQALYAAAAVLLATVATVNIVSARSADRARVLLLSSRLAAQSREASVTDPDLSARLAAAAWRLRPTAETHSALVNVLHGPSRGVLLTDTADYIESSAVFSPDGTVLARWNGGLQLWDVAGRRKIGAPFASEDQDQDEDGAQPAVLAFSPDGRTLATAVSGTDPQVRLWDPRTQREIRSPIAVDSTPDTMAFSRDGRRLAVATDSRIQILGLTGGQQPVWWSLAKDTSAVTFSSMDATLVSVSGRTVRRWDAATGKPLSSFDIGLPGAGIAALSQDGGVVVTVDVRKATEVRAWDTATHRQLGPTIVGGTTNRHQLALSRDGTQLAAWVEDGATRLWDLTSPDQPGSPLDATSRPVAFSPDGRLLLTESPGQTVRLWDTTIHRSPTRPLTDRALRTAFSEDGRYIAASSDKDRTIRLWATGTRELAGVPFRVPEEAVWTLVLSADGRVLATGGNEQIQLWDAVHGTRMGTAFGGDGSFEMWPLLFSPDGKYLIVQGNERPQAHLWEIAPRRLIRDLPKDESPVAVTPDSRLLITENESVHEFRFWSLPALTRAGPAISVPGEGYASASFTADGRILAVGGADGSISLWDPATRRQLGSTLRSNALSVNDLAFSADGRLLASAHEDGTLRLWDVTTHQELGSPLAGHRWSATTVRFVDNATLVSWGWRGGTIRSWDVRTPADPINAVCAIAGEPLDRSEWSVYLPGQPYRPSCP
ncbi:NACHT and WD repeat domain-containing protein [Actinomadura scrupuli]|uniref:NACHT and WD repeat domain-containing protein n=1 Tax=Actinomadura scrupuli TaxID=559629 RepID=UPI003D9943E5